MSMTGRYRRVPEAALKQLLERPEGLLSFLLPDGPDGPELPQGCLDLEKSWHIIHFLLNGDPWDGDWPLGAVVLGGTKISDEDLGYGPARYLSPSEVADVATALEAVSSETLLSRLDPEAVNAADIYPGPWSDGADERSYIRSYYDALQGFFSEASRAGQAVVLYLC